MARNFLKAPLVLGTCLLALAACSKKDTAHKGSGISLDASSLERMEKAFEIAKSSQGDGDPALWKLADEDTTIYLYGTVHTLPEDVKWRTAEFDAAFNSAENLYLEADTSSPEAQQKIAMAMMQRAALADGQTLKTLLSESQYADFSAAAKSVGIPEGTLDTAKPWFASLQLMAGQMMKNGYNPELGVESVLVKSAGDTKTKKYLETAEDQIKLISGGELQDQLEGLVFQVETLDKTPEMLDALVAEWADGDVKGLGVLMGDPAMFGSVEGYNAIIKDRNANWIPQIEAILDEPGSNFVAVGAGHLAGPDSVIAMLEAKGHKVEVVQ